MTEKPFGLIIEDEEDLSIIFSEALKNADFRTEIIRDGQVAMDVLAKVAPDVVVLDINLPHVSGKEILRYLHSDPRLSNTKVLVVTADAASAEMLESEADLILVKPVSFVHLGALAARLGSVIS